LRINSIINSRIPVRIIYVDTDSEN